MQWFFKPEELYEKMNDKLPTKVPMSVRGRCLVAFLRVEPAGPGLHWENGWRCFTVDSHPSTWTWDFSFPNGNLFLLSDIRYCRTDQVSSQNPRRISLSHVVRHNCKLSPTNVWELKLRGSRQVHCVHKRENKPYTVFILIEGGVGYAFLYRDSRETHDDNQWCCWDNFLVVAGGGGGGLLVLDATKALWLRNGEDPGDKKGDRHCAQGAARGRWKLYAPDSSCFVW